MARKLYGGAVSEPPFEGREIIVRGESFIVPELALGARRSLSPKLRWMYERFAAPGAGAEAPFAELERLHELWFEGALIALKMNYPQISADVVAENFSLSQLRQCFEAAVGAVAEAGGHARPTPAALSAAAPSAPTPSPTGAPSTDF
jgi:hypothetical protein